LLADTNYTVYVRSLCIVNGPSDWSGGTNFKTKEQCPKPTALLVTTGSVSAFGATFTWTNPLQSSWQILVQLASLPTPLATDPAWTNVPGTVATYTATGLIPETAYEYYVRTDCGLTIISGPAGPKAFTTGIACPKPTALTAVSIPLDPYTYTLGWTNPGQSSWQILVQLASEPAPTASSTGWVTTNGGGGPGPLFTYAAPGLLPETAYEFYIRTDCGVVDGVSTWAGPKAFTTIPACYKPTNFQSTAAALTAFSATLTWTSVATTTAWQVLALPVGSPAPTASSTGWLPTDGGGGPGPNYTFVYPGLTPETAYNFYIRGNCGNIIGSPSTWTGPRAVTTPPSCYKPSALTANVLSSFTAELGWTNNVNSPVTEWQISIQATGSPAPAVSSTGTIINLNPYTATGLTQNTCYDYYVRSSCGGINGVSTWAGPFNFCTPPTCPQPVNLSVTNQVTPEATITWTEAPTGAATQWAIIVQAPSGPVPGPSTVGTIVTAPTYLTGILAPGFYEFYVRSNCSDTDKSFWTGPFNFFIATSQPVCASVEIDVATTSPGVIDLCPGLNCVDLVAEFTDSKDTASYTVLPVVFAPPFPFTGGTQLPINTDDVWGAPFTLPFNFCFYGINYPQVTVGSNGVITFDDVSGDFGCPWATDPAVNLPNPAFPILNAIYGPYQDINPAVDTSPILRSINYQVLGVAPCRAFVVNYYNVAQFSCNLTVGLQTSQIVLYETSNVIEVYVKDRTTCIGWNEGSGVIGIQNAAGTIATFPPDRNLGPWEAQNEAWRFTPDGNSNVVFSWLKDGAFYSNAPAINVCVTETTNMTAQAVYTGCGGQITTKTEDVLLRINEVIIPPIQDEVACVSYTLPTLTVGNYFNQPGGIDPILNPVITGLGPHIIYVYAETTTIPACTYEISFTVEIQDVLAPLVLPPVTSCVDYVLPILTSPFNYYTGLGGTGTMYSGLGGDIINSTQTLNVYGVSGLCVAESQLSITIDPAVVLQVQNSVSGCNGFTLPGLLANNAYYTAAGGPTGTGTLLNAGDVISSTQTVYIYAQSGLCIEEGSFTVNVFGLDPPTVDITQPNCVTTTGTIEVTSPLSPGGVLPTDIFISEVTDESTGSLTYIELFNGTGSAKDLSNYKLKIYNNGNTFTSCDIILTGIIANNSTNVIKVSSNANEGGVIPDQEYTTCAGVNTNDNIRLTNSTDAEIDLWGSTDGVDFTPNNEPGYTYRRISSAPIPSTTWNPADWTAIDPQDYSNVDLYTPFSSFVYQYNIDGGPWQFTTTFTNVPLGPHVINVQDITTGCTSFLNVTIQPDFVTTPVTTISYTTPVCNNASNLTPDTTAIGFATGGTYTSNPATLVINATTGEVDVVNSPSGTYIITYAVLADLPNCIGAGSSTFTITIDPIITPNFDTPLSFCEGTVVPDFVLTSPNGIAGTWSPLTIDNTADGTYTFTPDAGQCAIAQTISVVITAPNINPGFLAITPFCSGTVAPLLLSPSPVGITGIWSPPTIDNLVDGTYTFTPDAGQCATQQTLSTVITAPNVDPGFTAITPFCAGTVAPLLLSPSPNGITGIWSPTTIDNTVDGTYTFTPNAGQCAIPNTLNVTVLPSSTSDFDTSLTICSGGTVPTLDSPSPNGITGTWLPSVVDPTQSGIYVFTPDAGQCATGQNLDVTVNSNPEFTIIPGCINGDYTLTIISDINLQSASFIWKDASGTTVGTNSSSIVVTQVGNYTCEVTYEGCSTENLLPVITITCTIQKGISPSGTGNGDGLNDYFDLEGQNVTKLEIFNRYGTKVYSKSNYSKEWYGQTDSGDELPDGTYFYVIERNSEKSKTGWIYINHEL
jgi:gliding motility-associated-like protein